MELLYTEKEYLSLIIDSFGGIDNFNIYLKENNITRTIEVERIKIKAHSNLWIRIKGFIIHTLKNNDYDND